MFFVLLEYGTPLILGLEIHEIFGVEKAGGIRSVVWPPHLADNLIYFRKRCKHPPRLIHNTGTFGRPRAWRKCRPGPNGSLIQVGKKLGADDAAEGQITRHSHGRSRDSHGDPTKLNGAIERIS